LRFLPLLAAAFLAACGGGDEEPTIIDGSSEERFVASAAAARSELPLDERLVFDEAINTVGGRMYSEPDRDALARRTFDGMTAEQVVEDARARGITKEGR
jgi:hypothetical protein